MSLQVWLPLNGDLRNQGLYNTTISSSGGITINNSGKIGSCYYFDGTNDYIKGNYYATDTMSFCLWVKFTGSSVKSAHLLDCRNSDASTGYQPMYITGSSIQIGGVNSSFPNISYTWVLNTWYHIAVVYNPAGTNLYINGNKIGTGAYTNTASKGVAYNQVLQFMVGSRCSNSNYQNCYVNDVRIYNHALSQKEVKEIAKGLVLHYRLNRNQTVLNNCYSHPTFDTSSADGGWSHWGQSGHAGSQGQNTDKKFIYNKSKTYSHWWSNGTGATGNYLLYQSPAFGGGYRSLQAILKEENGMEITENICYPAWNARNGGIENNKWSLIIPLGDNFYLCKAEGISQDGSNDLVGIYIKPGYKVYVSEAYLENNKQFGANIFNQSDLLKIQDSSGYGYNGTLNNNFTEYIKSGIYEQAPLFGVYQSPRLNTPTPKFLNGLTNGSISWWEYCTTTGNSLPFVGQDGSHYIGAGSSTGRLYDENAGTTSILYKDGAAQTNATVSGNAIYHEGIFHTQGSWHHFTLAGINLSSWTAFNINNYSSGWPVNAYLSDIRIYSTVLSPEDVQQLYKTGVQIDDSYNLFAREVNEQ